MPTLKATSTKANGDREIRVSLQHLGCKRRVQKKLRSKEGNALPIRRMVEPKSVFGQLKNNRGFRRFLLRDLSKVCPEVGEFPLPTIC
ncbi:transposase [Paenibacillus sp. MER 180]|uniref:transposase n=1 Tax=Paenibacillus sp. MER 180 TaxID=2939570 RepID=UPI00203D1E04|nr:transposase [Paenibacillus sp. MER 180]MCM3294103.1 transposase [Paenibacillus sp. MER 180]